MCVRYCPLISTSADHPHPRGWTSLWVPLLGPAGSAGKCRSQISGPTEPHLWKMSGNNAQHRWPHIWIFILAKATQQYATIRLLNGSDWSPETYSIWCRIPTAPHEEVPNLHCHGDHGHVVRCCRTHGSHCPRSFCSHFLSSFINDSSSFHLPLGNSKTTSYTLILLW